MRIITLVLAASFFGLLTANGFALWAIYPTNHVIASWIQPLTRDQQQTQYEIQLIEKDRRLFYGPFERTVELNVHRIGTPGYGHSVPVRLQGKARESECRDTCFVNWGELGVEFTQTSGHRLFIPTSAYVGGR